MSVVQFPPERMRLVREVSVQISKYPQDDGRDLFSVEVLYPDGTWDHVRHAWSREKAEEMALEEADARDARLLAVSMWPGRSALA